MIDFKWVTYTKAFYLNQPKFFLAFIALFTVNIYLQNYISSCLECDTIVPLMFSNILDAMACGLICFLNLHEVKTLIRIGYMNYFTDIWNYVDIALFFTFLLEVIVNYLDKIHGFGNIKRFLQTLIILLSFIKLNFFLRIFEGFSFLVSMLRGVFSDLKFFLSFFAFVVITFSLILSVLIPDASKSYPGTSFFAYVIMAFRTSLGDFEIEDYKSDEIEMKELVWVVWLMLMIIGNVIFMNFIVAVVSESYEKCMQTQKAQQYRLKCELIVERESIMSEDHLNKKRYFPNYLVLRQLEDYDTINETQEWQGFVKDIKIGMRKHF